MTFNALSLVQQQISLSLKYSNNYNTDNVCDHINSFYIKNNEEQL